MYGNVKGTIYRESRGCWMNQSFAISALGKLAPKKSALG